MEHITDVLRLPAVLIILGVLTGVALGLLPQPGAGRARWLWAVAVGLTTLLVGLAATDVPLAPVGIVIGFAATGVLRDVGRRRRARSETEGK